jgi:hypothetical protein
MLCSSLRFVMRSTTSKQYTPMRPKRKEQIAKKILKAHKTAQKSPAEAGRDYLYF